MSRIFASLSRHDSEFNDLYAFMLADDGDDEDISEELDLWKQKVEARKGLAFLRHDQTGQTALMAGIRRHCSLVKLKILLEKVPECAKFGDKKGLPLHIAIQNDYRPEALSVIVEAYPGALRVPDVETRRLPLHMLLDVESFGQETADTCRLMLEKVPEAAKVSCNDRLPLHVCLERHLPAFLTEYVLSKYRAAAATPMSGMLPLHVAVCQNQDPSIIMQLIAAHPGALILEIPGSGLLPVECAIEKQAHSQVILNLMNGGSSGHSADPKAVAYARASSLGLGNKTPQLFDGDRFSHRIAFDIALESLPAEAWDIDSAQQSILVDVEKSIRGAVFSLPAGHRLRLFRPHERGKDVTCANETGWVAGSLTHAPSTTFTASQPMWTVQSIRSSVFRGISDKSMHGDGTRTISIVLEACIDTTEEVADTLKNELDTSSIRIKQDAEERIRSRLRFLTSPEYEGELANATFADEVGNFYVLVGEAQLTALTIPISIFGRDGKFTLHMGIDDTVGDIKRRVRRKDVRATHAQQLRLADDSIPGDRVSCGELARMIADLAKDGRAKDDGGAIHLDESHELLQLALRSVVEEQIVVELLALGAHKAREVDSNGMLPLHLAMLSGISDAGCELLFDCHREAARECVCGHGLYPLDLALERKLGQSFVDKLLQEARHSDWTEEGYYNPERIPLRKKLRLPLHVAVYNGYEKETLKKFEDSGCQLEATDKESGESLLDCALTCKRFEELQNTFPNMMNSVGEGHGGNRRPLHQAVATGAPESMVREMCKKYWNEEAGYCEELLVRDKDGSMPIHLACAHGATFVVVRLLLDFAPDAVLEPDRRGRLPIHLAVENQARPGVVSELLSQEEDMVSAVAPCGRNLLELAAKAEAPLWVIMELVEYWPQDGLEFNLLSGAWPRNRASTDIHRLLREKEAQQGAIGALAEPGLHAQRRAEQRVARLVQRSSARRVASAEETAAQGPAPDTAHAEEEGTSCVVS